VKILNVLVLTACGLLAGCAGTTGGGGNVHGKAPDTEAQQRARLFTELAGAYFERAQYKIALEELRKAVTADSRFGPAYNVYGLVYMELAEDTLAEEYFRRAIELDRNDSIAHNNFGWFLCTRGRYDEGLSHFQLALRNPLYATPEQAIANAGMCAERKGDLTLAEANLLKSLKLRPDNPNVILKLAGVQLRQGRLVEARGNLQRYRELAQPSAESLWLGIRLERKLGDRAQEAAYGLQLRRNFPNSAEAQLLMAGQYE
jgi:type IV pilus assembly protein PilF